MGQYWLESLEEHIANVIDERGLDPEGAWEEIHEMAKANLEAYGPIDD